MVMMGRRERIPHYDDAVEVGRRLNSARQTAGLSQRELAFPGCSAAYISRIERGERVPSLQVMRELARRIGVTESELAYGRERLHPDVVQQLRRLEQAETDGSKAERARAYATLGRTAARVARALQKA
jgi:transcriptional regulator with XRE-family HTH domain